jgi:hypothetical protein
VAKEEKAAELSLIGRDIYQYDKSMDVLKTAAGNEGAGSTVMQSGIGLGMGMTVGNQMGQQAGQMITQLSPQASGGPPPPPQPVVPQFHIVFNNQQLGPFPIAVLQQMVTTGSFNAGILVWRQGMTGWQAAGTVPELAALFPIGVPPPPPYTVPPPT